MKVNNELKNISEWLAHIEALHSKSIDLGLDRIQRVAETLSCHQFICPVITVAGTNGKGSCIATMASITSAAGLRVGTYTSPHLKQFNERIVIAGKMVDDAILCDAFEKIEKARMDISLSYFEFTTLAALLILQQANLDLVLLEIGLGGRLDAVNIVEPDIAVITSIGFDHQVYLGETLPEIAAEKAGIMRCNKPIIIADEKTKKLLKPHADSVNAVAVVIGDAYQIRMKNDMWCWESKNDVIAELSIPRFPLENAAAAIAAVKRLNDPRISARHFQDGMAKVNIPGRFQVICQEPLTIIDVAHNPPAAFWLAKQLQVTYPNIKKWHAVFACQQDKAIAEIATNMMPAIDHWHLINLQQPLAAKITDLDEVFTRLQLSYEIHDDALATVKSLQKTIPPSEGIVAFGTFMLVGLLLE